MRVALYRLWTLRLLGAAAAVVLLGLAGCASTPSKDETLGWSSAKLYAEAKDEMNSGNTDKGVKLYEKLESRYPYGLLAQQALIEIAYGNYKQGERAQALAAADRFLKLYPNNPYTDYVLYLKGLINFNTDQGWFSFLSDQKLYERDQAAAKQSFESFKELVTRFPESKYAPDARQRMRYIVNSLAEYETHVALFYYRRGAYVAAADRAQRAIEHYQDAPATELALAILVDAYGKLGLTQLRDDAERVLKLNYPNCTYLTEGLPKRDDPFWKLW
ncbi:MAG TPA: outer membrane protein assembly factor BamD [Thiomonas arsenitoxydans]|uniref:outer membrane protein assembly factor BamD n=1 Tax=Thiomonas TaxID=32012 RepID=UPI002580E156|nr:MULTISPECIES: outer membrane protein assembly factor BamD [Thiomonas]HML81871.1 outer membrane protein assembly factor BamD [Thiomonas arsenitoxydans]